MHKMKNDFPRLYVSPEIRRKMLEIARQFRKEPTKSESILWQALRGKKLDGIKFRRQQPIGYFVVDFYNSVYRLVVEVDGPIHANQVEADCARQDILEQIGLNVMRVNAEEVEKNLPSVLEKIRLKINELKLNASKSPSPFIGRVPARVEGLGERLETDDDE
jgi:very-short-patch-repair endonuclease